MERHSNIVAGYGCVSPATINILHLIIDDKFLEFVYRVFQEVEGVENRYVALVGADMQHFKHIGRIPLWRAGGAAYADTPQATEDLEWCDVLVVHWWHIAAANVVAKAPDSVIVVWSGWGGDYYDLLPGGDAKLYGEKTKELLQQMRDTRKTQNTPTENILNILRRIKAYLKRAFSKSISRVVTDRTFMINRVDYFSAPIQEDYELLKAALGNQFRAVYIQLNYGSVEESIAPGQRELYGNDILLGNSATATNNHLEALNMLSSIDVKDRKIIVPLSYGSQEYGDALEKCGRRLLGSNFVPIRNFMPLAEYNSLISSCSIAIMNHRRQQALANIGSILCNGGKLFLDESSVVYKFLKKNGAYVYSVREIAEHGTEAFDPLSKAEKERNIEVINQVWGHDIVIDNVNKFVDRMRKHMAKNA